MDLFGPEDDWQSVSGHLWRTEYRLRNLRRVAGPIIGLHQSLMLELLQERSEYLAWVASDELASATTNESTDAADAELASADQETTILLIGTLVAYGVSLLEAALIEAADPSGSQIAGTVRIRGPKIEGWLGLLNERGVAVDWSDVLDEIKLWRVRRNAYVHELLLDDGQGSQPVAAGDWDIPGFIDLIIRAVDDLDAALCAG